MRPMMPRRVRQIVQQIRQTLPPARSGSWVAGLMAALLSGGLLGLSSLAAAQTVLPTQDPAFFPATGYRISSPAMFSYFREHGGLRTFGYPISNEFPLLGRRVQLFQRALLRVEIDASVTTANLLDADVLPITHMDGLSLPATDPDLVAQAPTPDSPDYQTQALAFVNVYVPDEWNGLPVNFQSTFLNSVACTDVFGTDPCDPSVLPGHALDVWGLPTSQPVADPLNSDFVYQRFQKGIMHFSSATGTTQGLLLGDWLKRVILGTNLPAEVIPEASASRFFAQYAPSRPLAIDRPVDLPDSSLAQAFSADSFAAAQSATNTPEATLAPNVAQTATAVAMTATAISGTAAAINTPGALTATAQAGTATASAAAATTTAGGGSLSLTPIIQATSSIPVVNVGCLGDEQMWFVPRKPNIGTHVNISVTSQRHHDVRFMQLGGPVDPGTVTEREGPLGFVWTWTIVPAVEDFYQWTFYADGLRPCITSGFNAFAPLGATATPTPTPEPTNTPGTATATPTNTPVPIPSISSIVPTSIACNSLFTINGNNFGSPPTNFGTQAILLQGATTFQLTIVGTGSNTQLRVSLPSGTGVVNGDASVLVSNSGGDSAPSGVKVSGCVPPTATPTATLATLRR